jgi:hypothetical protein
MKSSNVKLVTEEQMDKKFEEFYQKIVHDIKDPIMEKLDSFLKEIRDSRDEQTLISAKQSEHSDTLEHHEARLSKVEKAVFKN